MWFWRREQPLPPEEVREIKRKATTVSRAYKSCLKSNGGDNEPCKGLEIRLLETYSLQCCREEAARFQECYTTLYDSDEQDASVCDQHVEAMRKCLKKKGLGYPLVQYSARHTLE